MTYSFGKASKASRSKLHPLLRSIVDVAIREVDFKILDATRGRAMQTRAFLQGKSKAKFGQSAHNYVPAIAMDLFPAPYDWENFESFWKLYQLIGRYNPATGEGMGLALRMKIPLRCGIDWNMDDRKTMEDSWDGGHYELFPWRTFAAKSKLYED